MDVIAVTTFSSFACTLTPVSKVAATMLIAISFATRLFFISSSPLFVLYFTAYDMPQNVLFQFLSIPVSALCIYLYIFCTGSDMGSPVPEWYLKIFSFPAIRFFAFSVLLPE